MIDMPSLLSLRSSTHLVGVTAALGLVLATGACDTTTEPITTFWEGALTPVLPGTVSGRVVALTRAGRTQASIVIEDADAEVPHRWRISEGDCASEGELQGGTATYTELVPSSGGTASGDAVLSNLFRSGQTFAARVIRTPDGGPDVLVSCGELLETDG